MLKKDFLERFSISESEFREAGLSWDDLCYIAKDYARRLPDLRRIRDEFLQEFIKNKDQRTGLHSYRTRVKTPWHLVEKIIRKRCENYLKYRTLTKDNYMKFVTDTIGFRGLILYREDWVVFHKYLIRTLRTIRTSIFITVSQTIIQIRTVIWQSLPKCICGSEISVIFTLTGSQATIYLTGNITVLSTIL